jgi:hypothetical protein
MRYYFNCPKCHRDSSFSRPSEESSLGASLLPLIDPLAASVYPDSRHPRVQCDHCGHLFRQPRLPKTSAAKLATAIVVIQIVTALAVIMLVVWPELADIVPGSAWLEATATLLSSRLVPLLLLAGASFVLTVLICLVASISSSLAQKRAMSKRFRLRVEERSLHAQQAPAVDSAVRASSVSAGASET